MTRMSLPTPTLHTARLRLRPFDVADAKDLFALHSSADVVRYWGAPPRQMAQGGTGVRLAIRSAGRFPRGFATMIKEGEKLQVSTGAPPGT